MKRTDWLIDDDGDELLGDNGEYVEGDSNWQEAWEAIETAKGENPQFPTAGFGISRRIRKRAGKTALHQSPERFIRDLKTELEADRHKDPEIIISEDLSVFEVKVE